MIDRKINPDLEAAARFYARHQLPFYLESYESSLEDLVSLLSYILEKRFNICFADERENRDKERNEFLKMKVKEFLEEQLKKDADIEEFTKSVYKTIFAEFEVLGMKWNEKIQCYDSHAQKDYTVTVADLFKQNFRWNWSIDPRKNRDGFLNEVSLELKEPFACIVCVRNPETSLRHRVESVILKVRRKQENV